MPKILIADDQYEILHALKLLLKQEGFQTVMANSPEQVLAEAQGSPFDLILIDLNYTRDTTSGREGLDLIGSLRSIPHAPPVIVMTAWSTVNLAVEAMRLGAVDFLEKPWDNNRVLALVRQHTGAGDHRVHPGLTAAKDLEIARAVQTRLLPQQRIELRTLEYAVKYQPAGQVGGDYYDYLPAGDDAAAFIVADVSGKGISAAILMATIQSFFRSRSPHEFSNLAALVGSLNTLFLHSSPAEHFATLFVMRYCERTRTIEWINCGHTSPLLARADGSSEELSPTATVVGMFAEWRGRVETAHLNLGDTLMLFSDGLSEAADRNDQEFGTTRLHELCSAAKHLPVEQLVHAIAGAIRDHSNGPLADDLTILALRGREDASLQAERETVGTAAAF